MCEITCFCPCRQPIGVSNFGIHLFLPPPPVHRGVKLLKSPVFALAASPQGCQTSEIACFCPRRQPIGVSNFGIHLFLPPPPAHRDVKLRKSPVFAPAATRRGLLHGKRFLPAEVSSGKVNFSKYRPSAASAEAHRMKSSLRKMEFLQIPPTWKELQEKFFHFMGGICAGPPRE